MIRLLIALLVALICHGCSAPPIERSPVDWPSSPSCAGRYSFEAIRQGDDVDLLIGDRRRVVVLTFSRGELREARPPLVTGGEPRLEVSDGRACPVGSTEGDACVAERWASGVCWPVRGE